MQQQQPPQTPQWSPQPLPGAQEHLEERDLAALSPFWPKVAASLTAVGGLCAILGSLQTWMTVDIENDMMAIFPVLDAIVGIACIATATRLVSARRWAAITALVLSALLTVSAGIWGVYAFANHFYAVFVILGAPMCLAATGVDAASIGACDRAERARDRLSAQGLDLGI